MRRRQYLKTLAAAGIATAIAGCGQFFRGGPPRVDQFDTDVNLAEAGADTEGNESIVPLLENHLADDTLLYLPPGRYLMDQTIQHLEFQNVGIVGEDATIVPPEGFSDVFFDLGRPGRASGLLFEGLTFDFQAENTGSRPLSALVNDDLVVRDLAVTGGRMNETDSGMLRVDVTSPDGVGLVERLRLPDGAPGGTATSGCSVGDEHRGLARFVDCHIQGFPDNGLYADPEQGTVEVVGGYYANCGVACVRVGNDAVVRDVQVECDARPTDFGNMRGIRLRHGRNVRVENCTVEMKKVTGSDGGIVLSKALESATVKGTEISVDADNVNAIQVKHPEGIASDQGIRFEDVAIKGGASERSAVEVHNRDHCQFDSLSIKQAGSDRDGFVFEDGTTAVVRASQIDVTGQPIVTMEGSTVQVVNSHPPTLNSDSTGNGDFEGT